MLYVNITMFSKPPGLYPSPMLGFNYKQVGNSGTIIRKNLMLTTFERYAFLSTPHIWKNKVAFREEGKNP